jgi:hypothetical protein
MVFMPSDVTGKDRKLARPYHGPFRIINLTRTNAEVQLVARPQDQTTIDRLRKCYPELSNNSWTGRKGKRSRCKRSSPDLRHSTEDHRTSGPITRSMTRRLNTNSK